MDVKGLRLKENIIVIFFEARKEINDHLEVIGTIVVVFISYR